MGPLTEACQYLENFLFFIFCPNENFECKTFLKEEGRNNL